MSSTPATQESQPDQEKQGVKTKCPQQIVDYFATDIQLLSGRGSHVCGKTILINGLFKCDRCHGETSLAQLQAMRLLNGDTTHAQFMRELQKKLPLDQDPPAHDRAKEIMGDNFISVMEAIATFDMRGARLDEYLELLPIPFSDELLESVAKTHNLIPIIQTGHRPSFKLTALTSLCYCHDQWKDCSVAREEIRSGRWVLIRRNHERKPFLEHDWHEQNGAKLISSEKSGRGDEYVPTAGVLAYLEQVLQHTRGNDLIPDIEKVKIWCRPLETEYPMFARCEKNRVALTIAPPSFRGEGFLITARGPDLNI